MNALKQPVTIGLPFHGLATAGVLTTAGGNKAVTHNDGDVVLIQAPVTHPRPPARTPAQAANDAANGYTWQNYALLCGTNRNLGGSSALGANAWLYCDGAGGTWLVDTVTTKDTGAGTVTVQLWLRSLFGRFGAGALPAIDRKLGELTFAPSVLSQPYDVRLNRRPATITEVRQYAGPQPKPDGTAAVLNFTFFDDSAGYWQLHAGRTSGAGTEEGDCLSDVITLAISGDGSTDVATLGDGITGTVTRTEQFTALNSYVETDTGLVTSVDWVCGSAGTATQDTSETLSVTLFRFYDTAGALQSLAFQEVSTSSVSVYHSGDPVETLYDITIEHSGTITIGAHSYPWSESASLSAQSWDCSSPFVDPTYLNNNEGLPVNITWLATGASLYLRQHDLGDAYEKTAIAGWHGGVDVYDGGTSVTYLSGRFNATCHPVDGTLASNYDGEALCYV